MIEFEIIRDTPDRVMKRTKVINGWIVLTMVIMQGRMHESSCFVPDPKHEWVI